jgi:hypothetical protein
MCISLSSAIKQAKRLLLKKQAEKKTVEVWLNCFDSNPPPVGYTGKVLNIRIREETDVESV